MIELTKDKKHIVIKRDGREESFSWEKLKKVLMWATGNKEVYVNNILENIELKIKDRIKITELYDELIRTVSNMISPLYPIYDSIAEKLYTMKIYKETCGLKKSGEYPHLQSFLNKGIKYKIYDKKIIDSFSKEDIDYLNNCLVPDRDFLYTFKGIVLMFDKYCKRYKKKQFELPQITYMVAAMYSFYDDYLKYGSKKNIKKSRKLRLSLIKKNYDLLSKFEITYATPRLSNSMKIRSQLASCILNTPDDDTWSLNHTDGNMAVYSKFSGGIAYDASWIRASGSLISSNSGASDGPAPFIKRTEQTISSFNQQGCIHEDSYVEVLESVIINDGTLVPLRKIKKDYDNKNVILNQDLLDFINSNLKEFKLKKGFISKEDFKNIWIRKIKGETKKNIIKDYPCLSIFTFKRYISKYIRSLDKSSLKGFKIYKDYPYLAIHKDQTVIQIADLVLSKKHYTHKRYITVPTGKTTVLLHRMMYSTFVGDIPNNLTVDHIDNNKDNNDISNLNLLTSEENTKKQRLDGVIKKASDKLRVVNFLKYGKKINGYRTSNIIEIIKYNTILVPIKKVKVNDLVKSMNTNTGEIEYKLVEKVHFFDIPLERQYELVFGDTNITTSDHHPIFYKDIDGKIKYKRTDNMVIGDIGIDSNAKNKKLTAINRPHNSVKFADLTVKDNNNYFAKSFNSKGNCILVHNTRKGSCVVTFPWWHLDVLDLIMLKDAGGTEDTRARKLMYAIRISNLFRKRVAKDEYITLFDPKETPLLNETFDTLFDKNYLMYEQKAGIRKKRIKAKDLLFNLLKVRQETGNLYLTFVDNINKQNMRNVFVGASNLCCVSGETQILTNKGWFPIKQRSVKRDIGYADFRMNTEILWDGTSYVPSYVFSTSDEEKKLLNIKVINTIYFNEKVIGTFYADAWFTEYHLWKLNNGKLVTTDFIVNKLPDDDMFELASYNILFKDLRNLSEVNNLELKFINNAPALVDYDFVKVVGKIYFCDNYDETDESIAFKRIKYAHTYCAYVPSNNMLLFNGIYAHNCEITVPSSPSKLISEKIYKSENNSYEIHRVIKSGEIGICNLLSINLMAWIKYTDKEKYETMYSILRGCDNIIDTQFYPAKEGEVSNKRNRPIGIGVTNYANLLASNKLKYTDEETKQFTFDVFEDLYYYVYLISNKLARERGTYETFKHDKWAQGLTPVHISMFNYKKFGLTFKNKKRWDKLGEDIKNLGGIRFSLHAAIAPTACMTKDTEITELDNVLSLGDFLIKWGIDVNSIEEDGVPRWVYFEENNKPIIKTRFGEKELNRAWYNGKQKVRIIEFEDGSKIKVTLNHPLLVKDRGWIKAKDLKEDDDILEIEDFSRENILEDIFERIKRMHYENKKNS